MLLKGPSVFQRALERDLETSFRALEKALEKALERALSKTLGRALKQVLHPFVIIGLSFLRIVQRVNHKDTFVSLVLFKY